MRPGVLAKVVFPVESLAALNAAVLFMTRVDDRVEAQLLFALEGLQAMAQVRAVWVVALLVPCKVVFALQSRVADFTNKPPFHVLVADHVLVEDFSVELTSVIKVCKQKPDELTFPGTQPDILGKRTASTRPKQTSAGSRRLWVAVSFPSAPSSSFSS